MGSHTAMPGSARPTWGLGWRASPWAQGGQRHAATSTLACARSFTPPTVKLFHSSCNPLGDTHTTIQLLCLVSGYVPGDMEVIWLVDGQKATNMFSYTAPGTQEGNMTSTHSELNITQGEWVSQKTYTCQVVYQGLTFNANARKCTGTAPHPHRLPHTRAQRGATARPHAAPPTHAESDPRGVSSYLTPPSPLDLYVHKSPKITCLVVDLASTEGMSLTWSRESGEPVHPGKPEERAQFNGTISVTSTLPVDTEDWIEGETYHCTVTHPDLPKDLVRSIAKAPGEPQAQGRGGPPGREPGLTPHLSPGKRAAPEVYVFLPPEEDEGTKDKVTLTCLIQNFFPADISVQWLRNDSPLQTDQDATTWPHKVPGSRPAFFVFSRLEVSRADWEEQNAFTCQVVHEALSDSRILKKTVSKTPGK